uniref:Glycosyl hydrolase BNR repeat-containing protein n=1 Tax=Marinomonas sp. (strain MWYL1) TaxID=400668 RepID=A6VTD8_MARMS
MSSLIYIVEKATDSQSHYLELGDANSVTAKFGSVYSLIDSQTGKYPENVVLQQDEDHLLIVRDGEVLLVIEEYFDEAREASFDDSGIILSDIALAGMESDVLVEEPIWSAETATTITLNAENSNQTTDLANSTQPKIDMSVPSSMRPQEGAPLQNGSTGSEAQEHNEDPSSGSQSAAGEMGWGWYAAALGLGAVGMASGSSSGGSSSSSGGGSASTSSTTISSAAGIFFSTVQIDLYDASGNLISSAEHDYSTGDYVYTGTYSGPMLVEIIDINGTSTDYTDETTGEAKSLGTSLRAMTTTDGASDKAISVTPLTELATQLAGVTSDNRAVTTDNVAMNGKVATLFGLDNILDKPAVVTEDTSSADAAALKYGQALAILSGADSDAGNASAAETIATIASSLKEANSDASADLKLTSEVADILTKGLETFNDGPTGRDNAITSSFTFSSVPVLVNADGDVIKVINAEVVASTIEVKIKGLSADTVVTLTVGENTTTYTVTSDDIESGYAYVPITASWFQADGDGNYDVVVTVNSVESSTTIKVDTIAPDAPTFALHQDTGDSDSDGITSDTTVDVTLADGVTNWQYSLDGGSTWITRTSGSSFELKGSTTYNVGDIQVKQIDKAGNESDVTSNTSAIETLETLAPDLSTEDTGTSNSDGITNSSTVSVTFDDGVDLASWQYSLDGGSTWKDGTGTTFELAANKTYQADTIQVKQIDTQGNEEIATLSSKVVTDNTVSAPVTFLAEDSGQSKTDGITSDTTYRVKLANDVASWEYSVDSGANWVAGSGTSFELNENQTYAVGSIQVRQTDVAGNVSEIKSNTTAITTDLIAPDAPSALLRNDTGASDEDGITNNTAVDVALADDAVSWQYSLDGGETWSASQAASVTSFALADNTAYQAGDLQIRQYDAAGNVSVVDSNDQIITLDSVVSAPTLSFSLTSNDLTSTTVTVTLADDVASWEYSLDGGETWNEGSGERFSLAPLTAYDANAIQVRQTDIAGNISDVVANESLETDVAIDPPSFELASDTGIAADDSITSSATMNVTLLGGDEGAVSWNYSLDGGITWSDDQDISTTTFDLADNTTYDVGQILVTQTDAEGNVSAFASNDNTVIVDSLVGAPEFSLNTDTGSSDTDGITNDLTVNVDLADDVATWQYSLDSGSTWLDGSGTSFELAANVSYAAGAIQVKQIDLAGNESTATLNDSNIITDTIPLDAPTFSLNSDSGSSDTDNITNDSVVNVVLSEDAATWQYSTDAGITWQTGTGTSFDLAANTTYLAGDIQIQQTDAAGNTSASASNDATIEIDTTAQTPTLSLNVDSGIDDSDGITNVMLVDFGSNGESTIQSWEYSLDNGANWTEGSGSSFILADNTSYAVGSIQVRQTDLAGNLSAVGSNSTTIVTDTIALDAPSFALHADTGESNSDFITSDTTIDVTLDAEAASWEYSLDSGATWTEGSGTSFEMGGLQTYEIGQIQVRQIDIAGNISAAASNEVPFVSDSLPAPTVQLAEDTGLSDSDNITNDLTVNVTLDVNAASWVYSLDSGSTWVDGEGSSFELEADTTYAVGSIQVKQFDADENESAIFSNESNVITDTQSQAPEDIVITASNSVSTVISEGNEELFDVERYSVGNNGDFVVSWIKQDKDAGEVLLMSQFYNADGSEKSLPFVLPVDATEGYYNIEKIVPVGNSGAIVITWVGDSKDDKFGDYENISNLFFQLFDADGRPVGEIKQSTATKEWIDGSDIIALKDSDQFMLSWTEDSSDGTTAYLQIFDSITGEEGILLTYDNSVVASVLPTGNNDEFLVLWNEVVSFEDSSAIVKVQTYSSDGTPVGTTIVLNPEAGEYSDGMYLLGEGGAFIALMINEQDMTMSLQLVNDDGSLGARVSLSEFSDRVDIEVGIAKLNSDNDFAVTWIGVNEGDEPVIYTQSFIADGTAQNDPLALPFEFDADKDYDLFIESVSTQTDEGYFVTADYFEEITNSEGTNNLEESTDGVNEGGKEGNIFVASGVYFVDGNSVTEIARNEENDNLAYFNIRVLNAANDVLIFKDGQDKGTWETDSWVQIYNPDGTAKTEKIEFTGNINDVVWTQLNGDGDFFISWVEYNNYYDDDSASWVNEVTHHLQMFNADGESITPIEMEQGDDLPVSVAEAGVAYLVSLSDSASIETLADILALEEGSWSSVEVGADTDHVLSTEGLPAGQYVVYATDVAGNITLNTTVVTISAELLAEPDVELNEDTGTYDYDEITNDTQVNVTLTDGAVRWEYSLDHGATWTDGVGTSFNLTDNTTFGYYDIQIRQYDADGNVSEIATNSDGYVVADNTISDPQIEIIGNSVLVTLDDDYNEWYYSLVGGGEDENNWIQGTGDSFSLEPNTTYNAGDIVVYVEDIASNEAEFVYQQQVVTGDAYEAPSFALFEDSGVSDSDGVTSEGSLNVQLSDDAVSYEYSLDAGATWQHGVGAYILLDEGETFPASNFVGYQYDAEDNETELLTSYSEEHLDEDIDFAIGFLLSEGTVSWRYSKDGGETFTEVAWADADGHFIDLDYGEEYAIDDIQVRQIRSTGEVSAIATNDQVIITDEDSPYDAVYANSDSPYDDTIDVSGFQKLDGGLGDTAVASMDYQKTIQLGDTGTYVSMWYLNTESEEVNSQLVVQMLGANGEPTSDYMRIEHESITEYLDLMAAIPLADTGSFVVTWEQYDEETDTSDYYYQIIDENGAVGGLQSLENYLGYYGQFTDSFIIPVGNDGNFVVTDNYYDESQSLRMLTATLMNADGEIIAEITTSGDPDDPEDDSQVHIRAVGEDGNFVVVSKYAAQLYSSLGVAIGDAMPLNSAVSGAHFEALEVIGDTGSYIITSFKYTYEGEDRYPVISAQIFNAQGEYQGDSIVLGEGELNTKIHHTRSDIGLIGDDKMVVSWTTRDSDGGAGARITYFQTINADGTLSGEAITPFASIGESEEISVRIANIFPVGEQGNYVLLGRVDYVDSGDREYYAKFVNGNGEVTDLEDADLLADNNPRFTVESVGDEGAFVVAWNQTNLSGYGVSVQLYNVDGEPIGDTVLLEADPYGSYDRTPSIIELSGGEYIVTWIGDTYEDSEAVTDVYSQKFNADGTLANQSIVYSDGDIPVESNEDGFAYLVNSSLFASDFLSDVDQWYDGLFDTILNADTSYWNSTEVTAGVETSVSTDGLEGGTYYMIVTDLAGNVSVNNVGIVVAETVVFDLTTGDSTDVDDQSFSANITYDIYINVGDGSSLTLNDGEQWTFANNLGDDDRITLVSDTTITSFSADTFDSITWSTDSDDVVLNSEGEFSIAAESVDLWENTWASNPDAGLILSQVIATETPEV